MAKILIAYIPVLHEGYRKLLNANRDVEKVYVWGKDLIAESDYLSKEIRALDPALVKASLDAWHFGMPVEVLESNIISRVAAYPGEIVMPDDDISHVFAERYLPKVHVSFSPIFLRWDRTNAVKTDKVPADQTMTADVFSKKIMALAEKQSERSSDWWRHVGAVIIKGREVILAGYNKHVPSEHIPYANGDPRNAFHKGEYLELSTAMHAEAGLIAEAARRGIALDGAEIYVTTFPCPPCAKQIAYSGIKKIYYCEGYGVLDGETIMRNKGIEIIFVKKD